MRRLLLSSLAAAFNIAAFVNTNAGSKLYVCATPQPTDLNATTFAALSWVLVSGMGNLGETGTTTNILNYDTWDTEVTQKGKGISNAGDPEVEVARIPLDPGQVILNTAAGTNFNYAFKVERNDKPTNEVGAKPTTLFYRGLVTGPRRPNGRNEDFDLEVFTLALNQKEVKVDPIDPP